MNQMRQRAKDQMPAMLLTLMSIVQALALELLWGKALDSISWSDGSLSGVTSWLQVAATFTGIILVWVLYANNIMRFRWVPTMLDSVAPFFVGILQFLLISFVGPETIGPWLLVLALVFAVMPALIHRTMRAARRDEDNARFFESRAPATWRDFIGNGVVAVTLLLAGLVLTLTSTPPVWSLLAVSVSWILLLFQLYLAHRFWEATVLES